MPFQKGDKNPMYGKHHSDENKEKLRLAQLGNKHALGNKLSEETKRKIGLASSQRKMSEIAKQKLSLSRLGADNPNWRGDDVGYRALHEWVNDHLHKPELCELCNIKPVEDLANMIGIYNRDFSNWKYLCRKCHTRYDGRNNLKGSTENTLKGWVTRRQNVSK